MKVQKLNNLQIDKKGKEKALPFQLFSERGRKKIASTFSR